MNANLRKGMWVRHGAQIGIVNSLDNGTGTAEVHYVDENGSTAEVNIVTPQDELAQAAFKDIPLKRRPDKVTAKSFGYL